MSEYQNLSKWKDNLLKTYVQPNEVGASSNFLSSETMVLTAGPSDITKSGAESLMDSVPIGLVQNVQISQNKQINQLYEIGGRDPYMIPGRTVVSLGLSRVLFDGPSLMKALAFQKINGTEQPKTTTEYNKDNLLTSDEHPALPAPGAADSGDFFINLAS